MIIIQLKSVIWKGCLFYFFLSFLIAPSSTFAAIQTCEIKYGEKDLDIKKPKPKPKFAEMINTNRIFCQKIGYEYNNLGNILNDKPIYACCKIHDL